MHDGWLDETLKEAPKVFDRACDRWRELYIAALNAADGSVKAFNPNANAGIEALAISSDGSIVYAGGRFTVIGGQPRISIAALNAGGPFDGTATPTFNPSATNTLGTGVVNALAISGSTLYVGGSFNTIGGQFQEYVFATYGEKMLRPFLLEAKRVGFDVVEVSDNCVELTPRQRRAQIRLVVECGLYPIWEWNNEKREYDYSFRPQNMRPVSEYLKLQGRFGHLHAEHIANLQKFAAQITENDGDAQFGDSFILAVLNQIEKPKSYDPGTGNYNQFWVVERDWHDRRTSLVTDPPDGKVPPLIDGGNKRAADAAPRQMPGRVP